MYTSHYITLPCKVTSRDSSDNKLENFSVNLPNDGFELEDEWEIGLTEISIPKIWCNLPKDQTIKLVRFSKNDKNYMKFIETEVLKIEKGNYTVLELVLKCNEQL